MDDTASAIAEQQKLATSQKPKKRQRNKKTNGKGSANISPSDNLIDVNNGQKLDKVGGDAMVSTNGISEKLEQLHITGDGLQMNGVNEKCSNQVSSHAVQNGHHTPSTVNNTNDSTRVSIAQPQQQQSPLETPACVAVKKSKSKSNKQINKEPHQTSNYSTDEPSSPAITRSMEALDKTSEVAEVKLKNGFQVCVNKKDNILHCKESQQQCAPFANTELSTISNNETEILTTVPPDADAVARVFGKTVTVSTPNTCPQQNQLPTTITVHNNTTKANPPTAIHSSNNTAKQDEDDAQQASANAMAASAEKPTYATTPALDLSNVHIEYKEYESELQMHDIMRLIQAELSEPYSIYTYRYFIYNWPKLCFLAAHGSEYVGAIVCKLDMHMNVRRGYIAMLAVRKEYRKLKIGTTLVQRAIEAMLADNADEVVLETEMRNVPALRLYENLGFVRDKRLFRYYLNGVDALRLKLWFR
ncbi:N-alpha-acetyltransferase 30A [Anastrepha ludens]|uniref:N-alpha-acetyltransferase 30A n=1 Tax=Anastrepha ludens TaxID=28586 RepID=UPI0023AFB45B|nr:N-alpha-acetyltransferase 30A [Anastrepha ludens]